MTNLKIKFSIGFLLISFLGIAQNTDYTLSDDSVVNRLAGIKKAYFATRTELKPKIDGKLEDECWKTVGSWEGGFIQQQPKQAKPPSQQTEIKILYDNNYLYFAMRCFDNEPQKMSPILGKRDDITSGDIAGIAIDSYFDKQTAFEFNLTSAGQKVDLMHLGQYKWDFNWNAVWDGKTSIGDSAWYAEMRVPFSQIRFANKKEHIWGMHVWRWIHRLKEEDQWKLIPIDAPAMVYIFGELRGISDIPYKRNFEIMPYASAKTISNSEDKQHFGFGFDGKIGVTSDFTLDYTVNPDFGQVEADPSELNLSSYEVFYEEKRPFFLEGKSILDYSMGHDLLFYSRRVGHAPSFKPQITENQTINMPENTTILNALKLTGKNKSGLSLGIMNSMTSREDATITSENVHSKQTVEPFTNYFVARIKQDWNEGNTILGGMATSVIRNIKDDKLSFMADNSWVGGFDFEHNWLNRKYFVEAKSFFSRIGGSSESITELQKSPRHLYHRSNATHLELDENATSMEGWGGVLKGGKRSGKFRLVGTLDWRSPGVDLNDLGYLWQADYIGQFAKMDYKINKPRGILNSYGFSLNQYHFWNFGNENLGGQIGGESEIQFKNLWETGIEVERNINEIDTRQLRGGPSLRMDNNTKYELMIKSNSSKDFSASTKIEFMKSDDKISANNEFELGFQWVISKGFTVTTNSGFSKEINNSQYVMQKLVNNRMEYVTGKINRKTFYTTLRAEWFITPEISFQYYGSPYASSGKYIDYKKINESKSSDINKRFTMLKETENGDRLLQDENKNTYQNLTSKNPDFDFHEFRSNFVTRWEYKTGSTLYFVWTNSLSSYKSGYNPSILKNFKGIAKAQSQNAFMLKLSYWFTL